MKTFKNHQSQYINVLIFVLVNENLLGLSLPRLDAQFADVKLAAAPPVWPADECVLLPAQLHDHQVSNVNISGDEEGYSRVSVQDRSVGWREEQTFKGQLLG